MSTEQKIETEIKRQLGNTYNVRTVYDNSSELNPNGEILIDINGYQKVNPMYADYNLKLNIISMIPIFQDKNGSISKTMRKYIIDNLVLWTLKANVSEIQDIQLTAVNSSCDNEIFLHNISYQITASNVTF